MKTIEILKDITSEPINYFKSLNSTVKVKKILAFFTLLYIMSCFIIASIYRFSLEYGIFWNFLAIPFVVIYLVPPLTIVVLIVGFIVSVIFETIYKFTAYIIKK